MNIRKLLPATIGAVLAGSMGLAQADVSVFGHIDESIVRNDNVGGSDTSDANFVCTTCSIGFKGSEDLGNGLQAIFKLDFQYDINNRNNGISGKEVAAGAGDPADVNGDGDKVSNSGKNGLFDRDQWLGLKGNNWGQVRVGTISTVYKSHGAMLDPIYRTSVQARDLGIQSNLHTGAGEEGQGRATNTARYDSPSWNGLKVAGTFTLDSGKGNGEDDNPYGVGASYENGGILVFADYITNNTGGDDSAWKVGGKYTLNNFAVWGQYEGDKGLISSKTAGTTGDDANVYMVGGSYTMGNNLLTASYGKQQSGSGKSTVGESNQYEIVGVHNMSRRSLVYAGYAKIDPDNSNDTSLFTAGMKHKF